MSRPWLRIGAVFAITSAAGAAWAFPGGISGYSGKQNSICSSCHEGGPTPTVKLAGPASLDAGASAVYTFTVTTTNKATGMNAAVSDGQLAADDAGTTRIEPGPQEGDNDEITHPSPWKITDAGPEGGSNVYSFSLTAPAYGGPITLYAAGNAVNLDNDPGGDEAARDSLQITVFGPPKPAATTPAPTSTGPTITPFPDAGAPPSSTSDAGTRTNNAAPESDSGCSMHGTGGSSAPAGVMFAGLIGLAAIARGRRKRA
jgi:MYXO-CTERM domain-containing protein